jgi:hypothetical protein
VTGRVLALALCGLCACADPGALPSESRGEPISERFVVEPLPAAQPWRLASDQHSRQGAVRTWSPAGSSAEASSDLLRKETRFGAPKTAPSEVAREELARLAAACPGAQIAGPRTGTEDGNDVAYGEVTCRRPALVLLKVVSGREATYLAERTFQDPPGAQALRDANAHLAKQVYLCPIYARSGRCATRAEEEY